MRVLPLHLRLLKIYLNPLHSPSKLFARGYLSKWLTQKTDTQIFTLGEWGLSCREQPSTGCQTKTVKHTPQIFFHCGGRSAHCSLTYLLCTKIHSLPALQHTQQVEYFWFFVTSLSTSKCISIAPFNLYRVKIHLHLHSIQSPVVPQIQDPMMTFSTCWQRKSKQKHKTCMHAETSEGAQKAMSSNRSRSNNHRAQQSCKDIPAAAYPVVVTLSLCRMYNSIQT